MISTILRTGRTGNPAFSQPLNVRGQGGEGIKKIINIYSVPLTRSCRSHRSKSSNRMAEKEITTAILKHLKALPQCFCWKEHGGMYGTAGIPDIICCYRGRFVAFEVKSAGGKPTKLQQHTIDKILNAGGVAAIVRSVDEVRVVLKSLDNPLK